MTSSDDPTPQVETKTMDGSNHSANSKASLSILDFKEKARDDASTGDEESFADSVEAEEEEDQEDDQSSGSDGREREMEGDKSSRRRDGREMLDRSIHSFTLQRGGRDGSPNISPCPSVSSALSMLGPELMQLTQKQKKGERRKSQLTLLVNDSASGALFDDVYDMGDVLGEGGFAFVYRCRHKKNGHEYAVKEILTQENYQAAGESVRGEIDALKKLREGPYVVRLLDVYSEPDRTMVVQEIMRGGDLLDKLTEIEVYEPRDARKVVRTLLEAVDYCHKKRICHRDIKPENILLVNEDDLTHIKIADFGCAKKITGPNCLHTLCGSPQYVAPELLTHEDGYDELCDMWSCGVVVYVLLGGYAPFDAPECELAELITAGNYEFHEEYWDEIPSAAKDLIVHLLQVEPDDRYTPKEALDCRWLRRKDRDLAESWHESNSSFASWLEHRNTSNTSLLDLGSERNNR